MMISRKRTGVLLCGMVLLGIATRVPATDVTPSGDSLKLTGVFPAPGSKVEENTYLTAEVTWSIAQFVPKKFSLSMIFESTDPNTTFRSGEPHEVEVRLKEPSGTIRLHGRLSNIYMHPKLRRPLRVWVILVQRTGPNNSTVVAKAGPVQYEIEAP